MGNIAWHITTTKYNIVIHEHISWDIFCGKEYDKSHLTCSRVFAVCAVHNIYCVSVMVLCFNFNHILSWSHDRSLTHRGRMTHLYLSETIDLENILTPIRRQTFICTKC